MLLHAILVNFSTIPASFKTFRSIISASRLFSNAQNLAPKIWLFFSPPAVTHFLVDSEESLALDQDNKL